MVAEDREEITNGVRPVCIQQKILDTVDNIVHIDATYKFVYIRMVYIIWPPLKSFESATGSSLRSELINH